MEYLYVSVIFVLSIVEEILFYHVIFRRELVEVSCKKLVPLFLEYIAFLIMTSFGVSLAYMSIAIMATDFYVGCTFTKIRVVENIRYWFISVLLISLTEMIIITLFRNNTSEASNTYGIWDMVACIIVTVFLLLACRFIKDRKNEGRLLSWKAFLIIIPIVVSIDSCLSVMTYLLGTLQDSFEKRVGLFVFLIAAVGVCVALVIVFRIFQQKEYFEMQSIMEKKYNEEQREYFIRLLEKEEETMGFRHDMINHLLCMQNAIANRNYEEVHNYLSDMLSELDVISCKQYDMGDEIVNVILNYYLTPLQAKCDISVEGYLGTLENISQMDLCTIFSNVLKNATEAVKENGEIRINGKRGRQFIKVVIGNSCLGDVKISKEGLPETLKEDKQNHGFGIVNIRRAMQKNGGEFTYNVSDGWFQVELLFRMDDRTR